MADNLKTTSNLANFGEMIPVLLFVESLMARSNNVANFTVPSGTQLRRTA